jgi:cytoskeletal protein CcmA (bactofilin family)
MSLAKTALNREPMTTLPSASAAIAREVVPPRLPNVKAGTDRTRESGRSPALAVKPRQNGFAFQARTPVITGEATYRGLVPVDGLISGQIGASGGALTIKQRTRNGPAVSALLPELDGEICFKDMLRVNGHVAGKVLSQKGTLIIDSAAQVDADIEVAIAVISGKVNGDVVGYERVELGPCAIINGNISTRSLQIRPGAVFHGDCRWLKDE